MTVSYIDENDQTVIVTIDATPSEGVRFDGKFMHRAKLMNLSFNNASFVACNLRMSTMDDAEAIGVDFTSASLIGVNARRARLCKSIFHRTRLRLTHFEHADLSGADLSGAEIYETHFEDCDLRGAIMLADNLDNAYFTGARFDKRSVWPEGFNPLEYGAILVEDENHLAPVEDADVR